MTTPKTSGLGPASLTPRAASSCVAALGVVLVPKCPLCVAAYLAGFGLSASFAHTVAPFVSPLAWLLLLLALAALIGAVWRERARQARRLETARPSARSCCERLPNGENQARS